MTAKRFTIDKKGGAYYLFDNGNLIQISDGQSICELLNELHEENQDLKAFNQDLSEELSVCANARISKDNRIKRLEEKIQRERISFTKTHERWSKEAETKIKELSEENEQLKQAYTQLKHRHSLLHDECIDAECDRDSYRKDIASLEDENEQLKSFIKELTSNDGKIWLMNGYVYKTDKILKGDVE